MDVQFWFWFLGGIAAVLAILYFAKDVFGWIWQNRRVIQRAVWSRSGLKASILKSKKIKVAVAHYPPLSYLARSLDGKSFQASGPSYEIFETFAKKHGLQVEVVPLQWHLIKQHLDKDGCAIALPIFPSTERNTFGKVVGVTHTVGLGAVSLQTNDKVDSLDSLRKPGVRVAVIEGEVGAEYLAEKYPEKFQSVDTLTSKSHEITDAMTAIIQERADVALTDAISCFRFINENDPDHSKLHNPFNNQPLRTFPTGFLVSKRETALASWLDEEIKELRVDKDYLLSEAKQLSGWKTVVFREAPEDTDLPDIE